MQKRVLSKILKQKPKSPPLTPDEIADVKKALKEKKRKVFKTPEDAIDDLHRYVVSS